MPFEEVLSNALLMLLCYVYVLAIIVVSGKIDKILHVSRKSARQQHAYKNNMRQRAPELNKMLMR